MTYALSWPLQEAIYTRLAGDAALTALVGNRIHDAAPHAASVIDPLEDYVVLGEDLARPFDTASDHGGTYDFSVEVHSGRQGYADAKAIAGAVCDALIDAPLTLSRGTLVSLRFLQAQARRGKPPVRRRIQLRFRAVIEDS